MIKYAITNYIIKYSIANDVIKNLITNDVIKYAITNYVINKKINNNFMFPNMPAQLMLIVTCLFLLKGSGLIELFGSRTGQCVVHGAPRRNV